MKITTNVACRPGEARAFMGLADVAPIQETTMDQMKERMQKTTSTMDPEAMFKTLFPFQPEKQADIQKALWSQLTSDKTGK